MAVDNPWEADTSRQGQIAGGPDPSDLSAPAPAPVLPPGTDPSDMGMFAPLESGSSVTWGGSPVWNPETNSWEDQAGDPNIGGAASVPGGAQSEAAPWWAVQPYLIDTFGQAAGMDMQAYGGDRVADMDYYQLAGMGGILGAADANSGMINAAMGNTMDTAAGYYMDPTNNPSMRAIYDLAIQDTLPQVMSGAVSAGRYGSGAHGAMVNDAVTRAANMAVAPERQNMINATNALPGMFESGFLPAQAMYGVGAQVQEQEQAETQAAMDYWNESQKLPWDVLANRMNLLTAADFGGTESTQVVE